MRYGTPSKDEIKYFKNFVLSYNYERRVPKWVCEYLRKDWIQDQPKRDRPPFTTDPDTHILFQTTTEDFTRSGCSRGHMAAAGNHLAQENWHEETFNMLNVAPQNINLNKKHWKHLEEFTRELTNFYSDVFVCTGTMFIPTFGKNGKPRMDHGYLEGSNPNIAIPTHFFKVVFVRNEKEAIIHSFMMPNESIDPRLPFTKFYADIQEVESKTGLLFYTKMDRSKCLMIPKRKSFPSLKK